MRYIHILAHSGGSITCVPLRAEAEGLEPTHQFPDTGFQDRGDTNYALHLQKTIQLRPLYTGSNNARGQPQLLREPLSTLSSFVAPAGFEPTQTEPKSVVLPLDERAIIK